MFLIMASRKINWKNLGAFSVAIILLCMIGVFWLDRPLFEFLRQFDGEWTRLLSIIVSFRFLVAAFGAAFLITAAFRFLRPEYSQRLRNLNLGLLQILSAVLAAGLISTILKIIIGRMRPVFWEALGQVGFYPMHSEWAFNSMPSGHAAVGVAALISIGILYKKYRMPVWIAAIAISLSRISIGAHWPSDVMLGAFIGMLAAIFTGVFFTKRRASF